MAEFPDSHRDLLDAPVATLATIGRSGHPQLSEVWFLAEGDNIRLSLNGTRQKTKNLRANPAMALLILDLADIRRYLEIRGDATIEADGNYEFADRLGKKYGADLRNMDQPGETRVVVTIKPVRVRAVDTGKR